MDGILLLLAPVILIALVLAIAAGGLKLFTGQSPKQYAAQKEVNQRADVHERFYMDGQMDWAAFEEWKRRRGL